MDKHNKWKIELYPLKNFNFNIDILGSQLFLLIKKDFIKIIKNYIPNKIIIKKKIKNEYMKIYFVIGIFGKLILVNLIIIHYC